MPEDFKMHRLFAYAVLPQRSGSDEHLPAGSQCVLNEALGGLIRENIVGAKFQAQPEVVFNLVDNTRTCDMRDAIIDCAFEGPIPAGQGAMRIAKLLGSSMDGRSKACLLVVAVEKDDAKRRLTMWTFPQDTAFKFSAGEESSQIDILNDVFSRGSHLRKAAMFQGRNIRTHFIQGRVLDNQLGSRTSTVADFWVERFLTCALSFTSPLGSRTLANCFRHAMGRVKTQEDRKSISQTITAINQSNTTMWSVREVASQYLTGEAKKQFLAACPNETARAQKFRIDKHIFRETLDYHVFELGTGVFVTSPNKEINRSVKITAPEIEGGAAKLNCEGEIVSEKLRAVSAKTKKPI